MKFRKNFLRFFIFILFIIFINESFSFSQSKSNSKNRRKRKRVIESVEEIKEDCATKYILGLDRECYNPDKVHTGGVYTDCSEKTTADYYDIMDMQLSSVVGMSQFQMYKQRCNPYKSFALNRWITSKGIVEKSVVKGSPECLLATKKLDAAKQCYSVALAHDGSFIDFKTVMMQTCGKMPDVADRFAKAGDLGYANFPKIIENYASLQFTRKSEDWRKAVEAIFTGYLYDARQKCGEETYKVITGNKYSLDKRENLLSTLNKSFVDSVVGNTRRNGRIITMSPSSYELLPNAGITGGIYSDEMGRNSGNRYVGIKTYLISPVNSIAVAVAKLTGLLVGMAVNLDYDTTERAILAGIGAALNDINSVNSSLNNLKEGDFFVIKQTDNVCQVYVLEYNDKLSPVSQNEIRNNSRVSNLILDCQKVL